MESENGHIVVPSFYKTSQYKNTKQNVILILADRKLSEGSRKPLRRQHAKYHKTAAALPSRQSCGEMRRFCDGEIPDISAIDTWRQFLARIKRSYVIYGVIFDLRSYN